MRTILRREEEIALTTKKHWLPILSYPIAFTVVCAMIALKIDFLHVYLRNLAFLGISITVYKIFERNYNLLVVTNFRVIEESGMFTRLTMESPLDKINNVSYRQNIWGRLFGYGDVIIQTAAQHGATVYFNVSQPKLLMETITSMQEDDKKSGWKELTRQLADLFSKDTRDA